MLSDVSLRSINGVVNSSAFINTNSSNASEGDKNTCFDNDSLYFLIIWFAHSALVCAGINCRLYLRDSIYSILRTSQKALHVSPISVPLSRDIIYSFRNLTCPGAGNARDSFLRMPNDENIFFIALISSSKSL